MANKFNFTLLVLLILWGCGSQEPQSEKETATLGKEQISEYPDKASEYSYTDGQDKNNQTSGIQTSQSLQFEPSLPSGMDSIANTAENLSLIHI